MGAKNSSPKASELFGGRSVVAGVKVSVCVKLLGCPWGTVVVKPSLVFLGSESTLGSSSKLSKESVGSLFWLFAVKSPSRFWPESDWSGTGPVGTEDECYWQ
jgi:hypothetical protein